MNGFEVAAGQIRRESRKAETAADMARPVRFANVVASVQSAMPGSRCSASVSGVADEWDAWLGSWIAAADGYAAGLENAAAGYEISDAGAASRLHVL